MHGRFPIIGGGRALAVPPKSTPMATGDAVADDAKVDGMTTTMVGLLLVILMITMVMMMLIMMMVLVMMIIMITMVVMIMMVVVVMRMMMMMKMMVMIPMRRAKPLQVTFVESDN